MASIANNPGARPRLFLLAPDGTLKLIRLSRTSRRKAHAILEHVAQLLAAFSIPRNSELATLRGELLLFIGDKLTQKLAASDLLPNSKSMNIGVTTHSGRTHVRFSMADPSEFSEADLDAWINRNLCGQQHHNTDPYPVSAEQTGEPTQPEIPATGEMAGRASRRSEPVASAASNAKPGPRAYERFPPMPVTIHNPVENDRPVPIVVTLASRDGHPEFDQTSLSPARHSQDFRSVHWYGSDYTFTEAQAAVVALLWKAWANGTPDVGHGTLLSEAKLSNARLCDVFKEKGKYVPAWGTMIRSNEQSKGSARLCAPETQIP